MIQIEVVQSDAAIGAVWGQLFVGAVDEDAIATATGMAVKNIWVIKTVGPATEDGDFRVCKASVIK